MLYINIYIYIHIHISYHDIICHTDLGLLGRHQRDGVHGRKVTGQIQPPAQVYGMIGIEY